VEFRWSKPRWTADVFAYEYRDHIAVAITAYSLGLSDIRIEA